MCKQDAVNDNNEEAILVNSGKNKNCCAQWNSSKYFDKKKKNLNIQGGCTWQAVWQWKHQKCCETFLEKTISKNSYLKNKKSSKVSVNQGLFYTEEMAVEVRVGSMLK